MYLGDLRAQIKPNFITYRTDYDFRTCKGAGKGGFVPPAQARQKTTISRSQHHYCTLKLQSWPARLRDCWMRMRHALSSENKVSDRLYITANIAKKGSKRTIPINKSLRIALSKLHKERGFPATGAIIYSERGNHMTAGSIVNYFGTIYG